MTEFVTIGAFGWAEDPFFRALQEAGVSVFCDLRRRRGVRGAEYAFVNSQRLQNHLAELGIRYLHRLDLAPPVAVRAIQHAADAAGKTAQRKRTLLSPDFVAAYQRECLTGFDSARFLAELGPDAGVVALFCVEREAAACHRSLLAARLESDLGIAVRHLAP